MRKITENRIDFLGKKLGSIKKTDEGYLQGIAPIAKVGIMSYMLTDGSIRKEYVSSDTLFNQESMDSLKLKPVTNQHPPEVMLDAVSVKKRKIGMTGETIKEDNGFLVTSLVITDNDAIESINQGTRELSPGYTVTLDMTPGEYNGEKYDAIQINRKYNHIATCDKARGGHDLQLNLDRCDGLQINLQKEKVKMPKIMLNNIDYEAAPEVINHIDNLNQSMKSLKDKTDSDKVLISKLEAEKDTIKEDHEKLQKSIPELIKKQVAEKTALDSVCAKLLSSDELKTLDGKSNEDIKKVLILKKYPKATLDGKDSVYIDSRFDSIIETMDEPDDQASTQRYKVNNHLFNSDDNSQIDGDAAYLEMVKKDSESWKNLGKRKGE